MAYVGRRTRRRAREFRRILTDAEAILWHRLRRLEDFHFRRQHPIGPFIADFASVRAKLVVEVDGATHGRDAERAYDTRREAYLRYRGRTVIRVSNIDIYEDSDGVVSLVCDAAAEQMRLSSRASN